MRSTRRDALRALGVSAAAATLGGFATLGRREPLVAEAERGGARSLAGSAGAVPAVAADTSLSALSGACFGTCTVSEVGMVEHGSIPVTLVDSTGAAFTVDVLRHDPASPDSTWGVAHAGSLAVYTRVGQGRHETFEEHGIAAMRLAAELGRREAAGSPVPSLLTLRERAQVRATWNRRDLLARAS